MTANARSVSVLVASVASVAASVGFLAPVPASGQVGVIEGRVTFEAAPQTRRSASRYPGGPAAARQIQALPAVAYLVGALPAGDATVSRRSTMTQRDTAFAPPVVTVLAGGSVAFPNGDPFFHNVFSYSSAQRFDLGRYPQGESKEVTFAEPGIVEVFCEVHEFMRGAILVTENPFSAVVAADGTFRIAGVPEGEHTIAFWHPDHERVERRVVVTPGGTTRADVVLRR